MSRVPNPTRPDPKRTVPTHLQRRSLPALINRCHCIDCFLLFCSANRQFDLLIRRANEDIGQNFNALVEK
jgi:hypothetical protein